MQLTTSSRSLLLVAIIAIYQMIGYTIGAVTRAGMGGWYDSLTKSNLTPPDPVFGMTWAALYVLLAIVTWRLVVLPPSPDLNRARIIFAIQILANWAWSFAFFTAHLLLISFVWIAGLVAINLYFVWRMWRIDRISVYCMLPYIAWISFACYLAGYIWAMNPS
jgi:tryptophan-rich sensory protein